MSRSNQATFILNPEINDLELQDALNERLDKASALAQFALTESISDHFNTAVHNYLWTLSQVIYEAWEINQKLRKDWS